MHKEQKTILGVEKEIAISHLKKYYGTVQSPVLTNHIGFKVMHQRSNCIIASSIINHQLLMLQTYPALNCSNSASFLSSLHVNSFSTSSHHKKSSSVTQNGSSK